MRPQCGLSLRETVELMIHELNLFLRGRQVLLIHRNLVDSILQFNFSIKGKPHL